MSADKSVHKFMKYVNFFSLSFGVVNKLLNEKKKYTCSDKT